MTSSLQKLYLFIPKSVKFSCEMRLQTQSCQCSRCVAAMLVCPLVSCSCPSLCQHSFINHNHKKVVIRVWFTCDELPALHVFVSCLQLAEKRKRDTAGWRNKSVENVEEGIATVTLVQHTVRGKVCSVTKWNEDKLRWLTSITATARSQTATAEKQRAMPWHRPLPRIVTTQQQTLRDALGLVVNNPAAHNRAVLF